MDEGVLDIEKPEPGIYLSPVLDVRRSVFKVGDYKIRAIRSLSQLKKDLREEVLVVPSTCRVGTDPEVLRGLIDRYRHSKTILICPRMADLLGLDCDGFLVYGTGRFWRDLVFKNVSAFASMPYVLNSLKIISLGKNYLGLLRCIDERGVNVRSLLYDVYLYRNCFNVSEGVVELLKSVNMYILYAIYELFSGEEYDRELSIETIVRTVLSYSRISDNIYIDIRVPSHQEDYEELLKLSFWNPRAIVRRKGYLSISGIF